MRVGVFTYHFVNNYGAVLQAYCFQEILRKLRTDVEFVDF